ncbi:hypothetical protein [Pseudoduganella violaceinigra]|uniref:hypothetical protein n=1 Tax=Pseudoduganella violaceinigra TaxID=246602 RepID=UPI0003FE7CFE|nr:hypothetical protein [Pseudoduganella violaceinigra]
MLIAYEILLPLLAGLAISVYLRGVLRNLLLDLCGTAPRADFWVRVATVLFTAFPLLLAVGFGHSGASDATAAGVLRTTLVLSTAGVVAGVVLLAWNIAKSIPRSVK